MWKVEKELNKPLFPRLPILNPDVSATLEHQQQRYSLQALSAILPVKPPTPFDNT